jgi:hemerythrin superfamily protein
VVAARTGAVVARAATRADESGVLLWRMRDRVLAAQHDIVINRLPAMPRDGAADCRCARSGSSRAQARAPRHGGCRVDRPPQGLEPPMDMPVQRTLAGLSAPITKMIRMDHSHVMVLSHRYTADIPDWRKKAIAASVCLALEIHAQLEEEIFYPALREADPDNDVLGKSKPEHDEMRRLIQELRSLDPGDAQHDETFHRLMRSVMHHVADEEAVLLPEAEKRLGSRLHELGAQMTRRRLQLARPHAAEIASNQARAMPAMTAVFAGGLLLAAILLGRSLNQRWQH